MLDWTASHQLARAVRFCSDRPDRMDCANHQESPRNLDRRFSNGPHPFARADPTAPFRSAADALTPLASVVFSTPLSSLQEQREVALRCRRAGHSRACKATSRRFRACHHSRCCHESLTCLLHRRSSSKPQQHPLGRVFLLDRSSSVLRLILPPFAILLLLPCREHPPCLRLCHCL